MWKEIEQHIETNRKGIDLDLPGDDIWAGIEAELGGPPARVKSTREHWFSRAPYWKVAAIVLMTVGISYFSFRPGPLVSHTSQGITSSETQATESAFSPLPNEELAELESYYLGQFNERWEELGQYDLRQFQFTSQFMEELEEVDDNYQELRQEIAEEGYHEQMIEGLIKTHKLKLKILSSLLQKIQQDQERNDYESENLAIPL